MKTVIIDGVEYAPVKKQEQVRKPREFWLERTGFGGGKMTVYAHNPLSTSNLPDDWHHVIELLPGSIQVSKEQLAMVWDDWAEAGSIAFDSRSASFKAVCRELGFPE